MNEEPVAVNVTCGGCEATIAEEQAQYRAMRHWCADCFTNEFEFECVRCGDFYDLDDRYGGDWDSYCLGCWEGVSDEEESSMRGYRDYATDNQPAFQSKGRGEFITSPRIFSAELECYSPNDRTLHDAVYALPLAVGVSDDGSLGARGVEFQTPKLRGKKGEEAIQEICSVLNRHNFTVDARAGLHVHLDGKGLLPKTRTKDEPIAIKSLLTIYLAYEDVLLSFLPPSRRGNRFCDLLGKSYHIKEIWDAYTLEAIEKLWYRASTRKSVAICKRDKYEGTRYNGVNLHSLLRDGHIEIRYHSGTLNATKILEWIALHQAILDLSVPIAYAPAWGGGRTMYKRAYDIDAVTRDMSIVNLTEKTERFFNLLSLHDRARAYFRERQTAFTSDRESKTEAANLQEACAA